MQIFVPNLRRSKKRWEAMLSKFPDDRLRRVEGVDGWNKKYSTGEFDENGKPIWNDRTRQKLIEDGVLHKTCKLSPAAVGCNLGHARAVRTFLESGDTWGIILEDDVEPTRSGSLLENVEVSDDCDFFYLMSADHPGDRLRLLQDGRVWLSRTFSGYVLNRRAAEIYLGAVEPIVHLLDFQISVRCFDSLESLRRKWIPSDIECGETFRARGLFTGGHIRHSELAKTSTMTSTGKKPWIDAHRDIR
jgi:hypothetical protein